jgi:predicted RNA-binding protein (virulence factor B family)
MSIEALLGHTHRLTVRRIASPGAFLAVDAGDTSERAPTILLPGVELPEGVAAGTELEVFIHLDSAGRPIATLRTPKLELDEVTFLRVTACTAVGAFVDWGLQKELLVPFAEQTRELHVGEAHPIGLYLDSSGRLAGTMRISEMLERKVTHLRHDDWVDGEAWRNEPSIGLFVIVERRHVGLVPHHEPHNLRRGSTARFRVSNLFADGKMELSLRAHAHEELKLDAEKVLARLRGSTLRVGDGSSPEQIRQLFGLSKKAFKRAIGTLLVRRAVRIDDAGFVVVQPGA